MTKNEGLNFQSLSTAEVMQMPALERSSLNLTDSQNVIVNYMESSMTDYLKSTAIPIAERQSLARNVLALAGLEFKNEGLLILEQRKTDLEGALGTGISDYDVDRYVPEIKSLGEEIERRRKNGYTDEKLNSLRQQVESSAGEHSLEFRQLIKKVEPEVQQLKEIDAYLREEKRLKKLIQFSESGAELHRKFQSEILNLDPKRAGSSKGSETQFTERVTQYKKELEELKTKAPSILIDDEEREKIEDEKPNFAKAVDQLEALYAEPQSKEENQKNKSVQEKVNLPELTLDNLYSWEDKLFKAIQKLKGPFHDANSEIVIRQLVGEIAGQYLHLVAGLSRKGELPPEEIKVIKEKIVPLLLTSLVVDRGISLLSPAEEGYNSDPIPLPDEE